MSATSLERQTDEETLQVTTQTQGPLVSPTFSARQRYTGGIQAIFAGFIAGAEASDIPPTIRSLWYSDQLPYIKYTLHLLTLPDIIPPSGEEHERDLQRMLFCVLLDNNRMTRPVVSVHTEDTHQVKLDISWKLRSSARDVFGVGAAGPSPKLISGHVTPTSPRRASIHEAPWWSN